MDAREFDAEEIIHLITTSDADDVTPPPSSPKPLTSAEKTILRRWINSGAQYESHWAFDPIRTPDVPASQGLNPIDAFITARLAENGLRPAPEADPVTLTRRIT
ncbi:MAG: hypothetical protein R3F13_07055 [Prosthecobacter sp.]